MKTSSVTSRYEQQVVGRLSRFAQLLRLQDVVPEQPGLDVELDQACLGDPAGDDRIRQWVLDMYLQASPERTRSVGPVGTARINEPFPSLGRQMHLQITPDQGAVELINQDAGNVEQALVRQRIEDHYLIKSIYELGIERL